MKPPLSLDNYMDLAKEQLGTDSDRALSRALGVSGPTTNWWRKGKTWPNADNMKALAELAGLDPHLAILDLEIWNHDGPAKELFIHLSDWWRAAGGKSVADKMRNTAAALAFLLLIPSLASAATVAGTLAVQSNLASVTLYIMANCWRRFKGQWFSRIRLNFTAC